MSSRLTQTHSEEQCIWIGYGIEIAKGRTEHLHNLWDPRGPENQAQRDAWMQEGYDLEMAAQAERVASGDVEPDPPWLTEREAIDRELNERLANKP